MDVIPVLPDLVELNNPRHAAEIADTIRKTFVHGKDFAISRSSGGRLLGGVIYNNFTGLSVCMHTVGFVPNWISRALIWWVFHYPFAMLEVRKLICVTARPRALTLCRHFGFVEEARLHDVVPEGDLVILYMVPGACRWSGERPRNTKVIVHPGDRNVFR